jgi:multidrug resistance efflux pump
MLEITLCSLITILPDFLYRRFAQGKRIGQEITVFSVWYELRWGISACAILALSLITTIFYFHPSTSNVTLGFRTVTILPETSGRVSSVSAVNGQWIEAGEEIFRLDDARQQAALDTATTKLGEIEAEIILAEASLEVSIAKVDSARASLEQSELELARTLELRERNSGVVTGQEIDRQNALVATRAASLKAAQAGQKESEARLNEQLPAKRVNALAALHQAEVEQSLTIVYAGTDGTILQFLLKVGDYINPILRPAGILVPDRKDYDKVQAGFNQISAQVIKPGMLAEITCISEPFKIIPMVVVFEQSVIAAGAIRPSDQLVEISQRAQPGTVTIAMEPLYAGGIDRVPQGSKCIANVYTSNHELLASGDVSGGKAVLLHAIDAVGLVHALILRLQAMFLPVQTLVFSGH